MDMAPACSGSIILPPGTLCDPAQSANGDADSLPQQVSSEPVGGTHDFDAERIGVTERICKEKIMGFATNAIHVGQEPDPATGAIVAPIYQTSTYVNEELGKNKGYDYARTNHPNRKALERTVAKLEGGHSAYVFSSGMAGIDAVFRLLRPGDHVVLAEAVYGGVFRLSTQLLVHFGLEFSFVDTSVPDYVRTALRPNTKMIYIETPANPTLSVTDIAATSKLAGERNLSVVVDNTFLSPYLQRPIETGAHIVVHSMTKYLNGHSDSTGGAVVLTRPEDAEKIYFIQRSAGTGLSPMDCFLVSRGIKTLAVRMLQHNANGITVARHLDAHLRCRFAGSRAAISQSRQTLLARGKPRWRRNFDFASGDDDSRFHAQGNAGSRGHYGRPGTPVGRHRGRRRHHRRPRPGLALRLAAIDSFLT